MKNRIFFHILHLLIIGCWLAGDCQAATPAPKPSPPEELKAHQLGILFGYANFCVKKTGITSLKDPDSQAFAKEYARDLKDLGPKGVLLFREGVKKGVFNATQEAGAKCAQNLQRLVRMYEKAGLKGSLYVNALNKYKSR